jgi:hypothetical protein
MDKANLSLRYSEKLKPQNNIMNQEIELTSEMLEEASQPKPVRNSGVIVMLGYG